MLTLAAVFSSLWRFRTVKIQSVCPSENAMGLFKGHTITSLYKGTLTKTLEKVILKMRLHSTPQYDSYYPRNHSSFIIRSGRQTIITHSSTPMLGQCSRTMSTLDICKDQIDPATELRLDHRTKTTALLLLCSHAY